MPPEQGPKRSTGSGASDPAGLLLSEPRLRRLRPDLFGMGVRLRWLYAKKQGKTPFPTLTYLRNQLMHGDSRAAVVMRIKPLLVAAYTDEFDCVAMLRFDDFLVQEHQLVPGSRLLTAYTYGPAPHLQEDLIRGPRFLSAWNMFHPLIADFLTDEIDKVAARKQAISEEEWQRAEQMGKEYLAARPGSWRDGRPMFASTPARGPASG